MNSSDKYEKKVYGEFSGKDRLAQLLKKGVREVAATQCKYKSVGRVLKCMDSQCSNCSSSVCEPDYDFQTPIPILKQFSGNHLSKQNSLSIRKNRTTLKNKITILDVATITKNGDVVRSKIKNDFSQISGVNVICSQRDTEDWYLDNARLSLLDDVIVSKSNLEIPLCDSDHVLNTAFTESQQTTVHQTVSQESSEIQCGQKFLVSAEIHSPPSVVVSQSAISSGSRLPEDNVNESHKSEESFVDMTSNAFMKSLLNASANNLVDSAENRKRSSTENQGGDSPLKKSREIHIQKIYKLQSRKSECRRMIRDLQNRILEIDNSISEHQEAIFRD